MFINFIKKKHLNEFFKISSFCALFLSIVACGIPEFAKPSKVNRDDPVNAKERARKISKVENKSWWRIETRFH